MTEASSGPMTAVRRRRYAPLLALAAAAGGLVAGFGFGEPTDHAAATGPNNPLRSSRIDACVRPRRPGGISAYALDGRVLPFTLATGHEPGTRPRCRSGELRILRLQTLTIDSERSYVRRGGCQQPCVVRQPTVHVLARDLTRSVDALPTATLAGDGGPVAGCQQTVHDAPARVGPGLGSMYYKTPRELGSTRRRIGEIGAGARWSNYGDPGRRYRSPGRPAADYNYLLWNLPRTQSGSVLPGGGIVEAVIEQGQAVELCPVRGLRLPSFDVHGTPNGSVAFGYARATSGGAAPIYGWLLTGYAYRGEPFRATIRP